MPHLSMYLRVSSREPASIDASRMQGIPFGGRARRRSPDVPAARSFCLRVSGAVAPSAPSQASDDLSRAALQNGSTIPGKNLHRKCFLHCNARSALRKAMQGTLKSPSTSQRPTWSQGRACGAWVRGLSTFTAGLSVPVAAASPRSRALLGLPCPLSRRRPGAQIHPGELGRGDADHLD
jgi:hypothetical protein